jgi:hypothetical protein
MDTYDVPECFRSSTHPSCRGRGHQQDAFSLLLGNTQQCVELAYPAFRYSDDVLDAGIDVGHGPVDQVHVATHRLGHRGQVASESAQLTQQGQQFPLRPAQRSLRVGPGPAGCESDRYRAHDNDASGEDQHAVRNLDQVTKPCRHGHPYFIPMHDQGHQGTTFPASRPG